MNIVNVTKSLPNGRFSSKFAKGFGALFIVAVLVGICACPGSSASAGSSGNGGMSTRGTGSTEFSPTVAPNAAPYGFRYFVGIVGSPSKPEISWSDEELAQIRDLGVNMLQMSIAWGGRPAGEVLNLEDLTPEQLTKWDHRVRQAKKFGFATMAQFGVPQVHYANSAWAVVQPACILDPQVRDKYERLLGEFMNRFPDIENVMFYTYDQDAWQCSEFGPCPRCSGIPLDERLTGFLNFLNGVMQKHHPGSVLWWKPWEISNGQLAKILNQIEPAHLGLILNPSCANEVYAFNDRSFAADLGIKRAVQIASDRKIPVIGEFDYTFYKDYYTIHDYCPRFVYENLQGWKQMQGVVGIKEYFGFAPSHFSVNAAMLKACMESPKAPLDDVLKTIAAPYGKKAGPFMIEAWEKLARGIEAMPWNTTSSIMHHVVTKGADGSHGWEPVTIPAATFSTPSWKTNRRANFMLTEESKVHPWVFEDIALRFEDSGTLLFEAATLFDKALAAGSPKADDIRMQRESIWGVARAARGRSLYYLETLAAHEARLVGGDPNQQAIVLKRLENLLVRDLENQGNAPAVAQKLEEFRKDPKAWLNVNFNPVAYHTMSTVDWSKFVAPAR